MAPQPGKAKVSQGWFDKVSSFVAETFNAEASAVHEAVMERARLLAVAQQLVQVPVPAPAIQEQRRPDGDRLRASTSLQLFRWDRMARDKEPGKVASVCKSLAEDKHEYANLPAERRAFYEQRAQESHDEAKSARGRRDRVQQQIMTVPTRIHGATIRHAHQGPYMLEGPPFKLIGQVQ
jgi:hypothetical protein